MTMKPTAIALATAALLVAGTLQAHDKAADAASTPAPVAGHHHAQASHDHSAHDHGAAIGEPGDPAKAARTVEVDMTDAMRFNPASVNVKQGETVRFVVRNSGQLKHEFVLGTDKALKEHYELMKKFPEMEHADPNMVTVQPGKTGEVVWRFTQAGKVQFACLQPGHYDAGMKGQVQVAAARRGAKAAARTDSHAGHQH
jgi:uncharacterized cupredoxin-like copper-binding protein